MTAGKRTMALRPSPRFVTIGVVAFATIVIFFFFTPRSAQINIAKLKEVSTYGYLPSPQSWDTSSATGGSSPSKQGETLYGASYTGHSTPSDINRVTNATLGFSKVFVIGLPERSDKRDAITLTSSMTGFHVEWIDGVRGESIPEKAVPNGIDRKTLWETNLGSWRGHMNAVRKIVDEGLESALIMEDDMDWDVRLRAQLENMAKGARSIFPTSSSQPISPYGDDWDILWLGHCGELFPENLEENRNKPMDHPGMQYMSRKFVIENDPSVPPRDKMTGLVDFKSNPEGTRWVHVSAAPICTFAYALSQRGARKVLFDLSVDRLTGPFDTALSGLCRRAVDTFGESGEGAGDRGLDTKCLSITPPLFFHHRAKGKVGGDSDIQKVTDEKVREKGFTENIMWPARNNIRNMLLGAEMESQY